MEPGGRSTAVLLSVTAHRTPQISRNWRTTNIKYVCAARTRDLHLEWLRRSSLCCFLQPRVPSALSLALSIPKMVSVQLKTLPLFLSFLTCYWDGNIHQITENRFFERQPISLQLNTVHVSTTNSSCTALFSAHFQSAVPCPWLVGN